MTQRIVVPLDQSDVSESALPLARSLARQLGARVTLLTVIDVPASFGSSTRDEGASRVPAGEPGRPMSDVTPQSPYGHWAGASWSEPSPRQLEQVAEETAEAERYLKDVAESFDGQHVETAVRLGSPAERILDAAESRGNAMIVLASHGRSGIGRAIVGSVAIRVVQASTSPVIVVRARSELADVEANPIRKVLVPVDGSTFSEQAIPVVQETFGPGNLELHLTSVIETPRFANHAQSEAYARWLADKVIESGTTTTWDVSHGTPSAMINETADRQDVDLIAMTTHGRSGLNRFVLGSVAERVLHNAERPLMLIPSR